MHVHVLLPYRCAVQCTAHCIMHQHWQSLMQQLHVAHMTVNGWYGVFEVHSYKCNG